MIFNITKENTTFTEADFAVNFLYALKSAFCLALFILCAVSFITWNINLLMIRLFFFLLVTTGFIHYLQSKYINVLQEYIKDIK
jgi:hypothetical protein|uniref:Uncharacterized protein n=1 Tax=Podoviridae sp. ctiuS14 TaxID=2827620 RepID=A0A8S5LMR4_9CAUD|nr:MAG TPA: hypothetical protein [Podoviridae sp. ctiuS14]